MAYNRLNNRPNRASDKPVSLDEPSKFRPQDYTILIVDDNPNNLNVLADYLEEYGFEIMVATDGHDALETAHQNQPDLILLDVMMPDIDGFETCRRLKINEVTHDIPVIFVTSLTTTEDKLKGFGVGGVDYVTKPIQQTELLARVTTHLQLQDISRRNAQLYETEKRLRETEEHKARELAELNASKDKFFSIVAHDLRSPFLPLLGWSQLLQDTAAEKGDEDIRIISEKINNSAQNIFGLLETLLEWSRLQRAKIDFQPDSLDLGLVVRQNLRLLQPNAANKNIIMQSAEMDDFFVYADANMLHTVIRNLLSNALKFTPTGGQVLVSANIGEPASNLVELSIVDTGVGIKQDDQAKLFQLGMNHSTPGTANEQGTGLGLIICQEMVEKNGGQIWIESDGVPGQGTSVKFTVPAAKGVATMGVKPQPQGMIVKPRSGGHKTEAEELVPPPAEELETLFKLISRGDILTVRRRAAEIENLDEKYKPFARKLDELAKDFAEEELLTLVGQYRAG